MLPQHLTSWPLESGWVVYGPENGYSFPYPRLFRVKFTEIVRLLLSANSGSSVSSPLIFIIDSLRCFIVFFSFVFFFFFFCLWQPSSVFHIFLSYCNLYVIFNLFFHLFLFDLITEWTCLFTLNSIDFSLRQRCLLHLEDKSFSFSFHI